jgi:hypothetical protein
MRQKFGLGTKEVEEVERSRKTRVAGEETILPILLDLWSEKRPLLMER